MSISIESRINGSLYGMACGDAMGMPSSFMTPEYIKKRWGWIDNFYAPEEGHIFHDGLKAGEVTDDTEQAMGLMNSFFRNKHVDPYDVVQEIIAWADRVKDKYVSPLGPSTERALKSIKNGSDITKSGKFGNTNGSAMRISPVGIIHGLRNSSTEELVRDVYMTCMPTHNTSVCVSSASAIAKGVAMCISGEKDIDIIVREIMNAADMGTKYGYETSAPSISKRIELGCSLVQHAGNRDTAMSELYSYLGGGDLAADTIPVSVALFVLGKGNPKDTIELCANFGGDCDTNGAMAGTMAGAYSGVEAIPIKWIEIIEKTNHINLNSYGEKIYNVVESWQPASENECMSGFIRL